eukprot:g73768.t1
MLRDKKSFHAFASKAQEVDQLKIEARPLSWWLRSSSTENATFSKLVKELQGDTELWASMKVDNADSGPETWVVEDDMVGRMRCVQKTIVDGWKYTGPKPQSPPQGNQQLTGRDQGGPLDLQDEESFYGQGYPRRGAQYYGSGDHRGPGMG